MNRRSVIASLALGALIAAPVPHAQEANDKAENAGAATFEASAKFDMLRNRGGIANGGDTLTHLELRLRLDLEKSLGWRHAIAYFNTVTDGGRFNPRRVGSLMGVSNVEVPVATTRLFHAWLQKGFLDDRFSVLAGLYPIDSEFFVMDSASILLHPAYGTPADLALTNAPSVFNSAAFGVRAKWLSVNRDFYAQAALMDGIPNDPARPKATSIRFARGDGAYAIAEFGWMPLEFGHAFEPVDPARTRRSEGLVAHEKYEGISKYAMGLWRYGNPVDDQVDVDAQGNPVRRRSAGAYVLAERTLIGLGSAGRDLTAFARYSWSAGHSTSIDRTGNIGLRVRGPVASRADDSIAIAWTTARLAPKWRSSQAAAGNLTTSTENAFEWTYRYVVNRHLAIQPNYQHIRTPGGTPGTPKSNIIGARLELAL